MEKIVQEFITRYKLDRGRSVVVAVSGGPDSMVLLSLLAQQLPKSKIIVAHANHGLRLEARWDEDLVSRTAGNLGLKFVCERLRLATTSEAEAREKRYEFLERVAEENKAKYIICAHHLNDQVETVIFSLLRGAGPFAVWGMSEAEGNILRPFLAVPKAEIKRYAKENGIKYHLDRTNYDIRYARNRIRNKIMPQMLKLNPNFLETIGRNAALGNEMTVIWEKQIDRKYRRIMDGTNLKVAELQREPIFVQKEIIRRALTSNLNRPQGLTNTNIETVLGLLQLPRGKKTSIGSLQVTRGTKYLTFGPKKAAPKEKKEKLTLNAPLKFGDFTLKMTEGSGRATKNNILLPRTLGYNFTIRTWRDGDRIKTKAGTKKLQDVFSDAKISAQQKRTWPIVVLGREIIWVPGLTASAQALSSTEKKVIKIEMRRNGKKK